jgi:DnaJ family protein B protein 12
VLAVEKNCTDDDLKKAFRKRAIKVHPDKNPAPQATDAFKKVNAAMACLSDTAKRR